MKKSVFIIILSTLLLAMSFVAFSATYDDLKKVFVTREEVLEWESSMSSTLNGLEINKQEKIQLEVGYQMYRRGIKLPTEEGSTINPSIMSSWSERRASELAGGGTGPFSAAPAPEESSTSE